MFVWLIFWHSKKGWKRWCQRLKQCWGSQLSNAKKKQSPSLTRRPFGTAFDYKHLGMMTKVCLNHLICSIWTVHLCLCVVTVLAQQEGVEEMVSEADEDEAVLRKPAFEYKHPSMV